ncbi:MAG TPA: hypothetical protein EYN66_24655 [Myxococcales bacterium]|nr:hypothetical protein [Myxococcales bacterium]
MQAHLYRIIGTFSIVGLVLIVIPPSSKTESLALFVIAASVVYSPWPMKWWNLLKSKLGNEVGGGKFYLSQTVIEPESAEAPTVASPVLEPETVMELEVSESAENPAKTNKKATPPANEEVRAFAQARVILSNSQAQKVLEDKRVPLAAKKPDTGPLGSRVTPHSERSPALMHAPTRSATAENGLIDGQPKPIVSKPSNHVTPSNPAFIFPVLVIYDVYSQQMERFECPTVTGLNSDAFVPIRKEDAPEEFGIACLPPPEIKQPDAAVIEQLLTAEVKYRVQLESTAPENMGYLADALSVAASLARATGGVIRDFQTNSTYTYEQARQILKSSTFDLHDHVLVISNHEPSGNTLHLHTVGLAKFGRADLEIHNVPSHYALMAEYSLFKLADYLIGGEVLAPGETIQLGPAVLAVTQPTSSPNPSFPYGLIRVCDYNLELGIPHLSIHGFLTAINS